MSFVIVGASVAVAAAGTKLGMSLSGRRKRIEEQREAREQLQQREREYDSLDTSNIYADVRNKFRDMENTYEDMTVNQQQAQFEAEQTQQQQANIMSELRGAAGGSGIAALAQTMANQGQLAARRASASIGAQEAQIQRLRAGEASRLQLIEREGELQAETMRLKGAEAARGLEYQKTSTQLGMAQQRLGAANQARAQAKAAQMSAIGDLGNIGMEMATGGFGGEGGSGKAVPVDQAKMQESYVDPLEQARKNALANQKMQEEFKIR